MTLKRPLPDASTLELDSAGSSEGATYSDAPTQASFIYEDTFI